MWQRSKVSSCVPRLSGLLLRVACLLAFALGSAFSATAASVTLAWDPNSEPDVAGYRLYYGTPAGNFGTVVNTGNVTNYTVSDLQQTATYGFYVTCYNTSGLESEPSNVVEYTVPTGANTAPVALSLSVQVPAGSTNVIVVAGSDPDADPLSFSLVDFPAHGTLLSYPPEVTYVAPVGFAGIDSFTFTVNDGFLDSEPATVTVEVLPVNRPPSALPQSLALDEDASLGITLLGVDPDGTTPLFQVVQAPQHGTLDGTPPTLTYRPAANYHGPDQFSFTASDGSLTSGPAVVSLTVRPVNDAPTAAPQSASVNAGSSTTIVLSGSDLEGDPLSFTIVASPAHGTLSGSAPDLTYTPAPGYAGPDAFTFAAHDATLASAPAAVTVNVLPPLDVNQAPSVSAGVDRIVKRPARSVLQGTVSDDGLPAPATLAFSWSLASGPEGAVIANPAALSTKVRFDASGTYVFRLTATDGERSSSDDVVVQVGTLPAPAEGLPFTLHLEAESGDLTAPMALSTNVPAADAAPVVHAASSISEDGALTLHFEVPVEADYMAWCRVNTASGASDSFYVSLDGDPSTEDVYDAAEETFADTWKWTALCGRGAATNGYEYAYSVAPRVFHLTAGAHSITFRGRERNTRLDAIVITSDSTFDPEAAEVSTEPATLAVLAELGAPASLAWTAIPGRRYQVLCKESFDAPWTVVADNLQAPTGDVAWPLPASAASHAFFTVVLLP